MGKYVKMNELTSKYEKINQLIKKYHNESLYSSKPLPKLIAVSKQQPDEKILSALKLFNSSSESKRSIKGGGVKIDSEKVMDPDMIFNSKKDLVGKILQIGKKIIKRFDN